MTVQVALHTSRLPSLSGELGQPSISELTAWQSLLSCRPLLPAYTVVACHLCRRSWKGWKRKEEPEQASVMSATSPPLHTPTTPQLLPEQPSSPACCHDKLSMSHPDSAVTCLSNQVRIASALYNQTCAVVCRPNAVIAAQRLLEPCWHSMTTGEILAARRKKCNFSCAYTCCELVHRVLQCSLSSAPLHVA